MGWLPNNKLVAIRDFVALTGAHRLSILQPPPPTAPTLSALRGTAPAHRLAPGAIRPYRHRQPPDVHRAHRHRPCRRYHHHYASASLAATSTNAAGTESTVSTYIQRESGLAPCLPHLRCVCVYREPLISLIIGLVSGAGRRGRARFEWRDGAGRRAGDFRCPRPVSQGPPPEPEVVMAVTRVPGLRGHRNFGRWRTFPALRSFSQDCLSPRSGPLLSAQFFLTGPSRAGPTAFSLLALYKAGEVATAKRGL